jgi:hypothetical protein
VNIGGGVNVGNTSSTGKFVAVGGTTTAVSVAVGGNGEGKDITVGVGCSSPGRVQAPNNVITVSESIRTLLCIADLHRQIKQNRFHYSQQAYPPTMQIYNKFASQISNTTHVKEKASFPENSPPSLLSFIMIHP